MYEQAVVRIAVKRRVPKPGEPDALTVAETAAVIGRVFNR
jgi:hypothetical protein